MHAAYTAVLMQIQTTILYTDLHVEAGTVLSAVIDARQTWVLMLSAMQLSNDNAKNFVNLNSRP